MAPDSSLVVVCSDSYNRSILRNLDRLRKGDLLCDITLVVENVHFKAHKALLAASSAYFNNMLTAEDQIHQSKYQLDGMTALIFATVLEFIYNARVLVEKNATEKLLAAARLMEVSELVKVLTDLTSSTGVKWDTAEVPDLLKRKRGRPKKDTSAPCGSSDHRQDGDGETGSSKDGGDFNLGAEQRRHSKRKIRTPVKYKGYKVDPDAAGSSEPETGDCRRKYPSTEAQCEDCGKVFKHHLFLKIHQRTHTGEKPFCCFVCEKTFSQKHTLLAHQRVHTGEKPFVCTVCSKALSTRSSLQEHMNLHDGEKVFECDRCGKNFNQKRQLQSHYRVHTGKSLPECAECHHKFMDAAQLKKHLRTHTGEKPFTCEICGKCFAAKSTLQVHIKIHRGEKPYQCNICNKTFSDPSARRRHIASHSGNKPFTCFVCSLSFTRLDNLKAHTKSHDKESAASTEAPSAAPQEEARSVVHLHPFQPQELPQGVDNMNFVPRQDQDLVAPEAAPSAHARLTLLTQPQNLALVTQGGVAAPTPHIHPVSALESQQPEHMHVITLSKEVMEHLQVHHGPAQLARPIQQVQVMHQPVQQVMHQPVQQVMHQPVQQVMHQPVQQVMHQPVQQLAVAPESSQGPHSLAIHMSSQSSQPISVSQTSEQLSSHHIHGQTFQIQAGTVSYLYTSTLPQES